MRIQSFLLLVALLALESQVPAVSGRRKGEKHGGCPPDDKPCLPVPDQCTGDRQCASGKKCCSQACFLQCVPRVLVKPGRCPQDRLRCLSPMKHVCNRDFDCPRRKRCCPTACGRDCRNPTKD